MVFAPLGKLNVLVSTSTETVVVSTPVAASRLVTALITVPLPFTKLTTSLGVTFSYFAGSVSSLFSAFSTVVLPFCLTKKPDLFTVWSSWSLFTAWSGFSAQPTLFSWTPSLPGLITSLSWPAFSAFSNSAACFAASSNTFGKSCFAVAVGFSPRTFLIAAAIALSSIAVRYGLPIFELASDKVAPVFTGVCASGALLLVNFTVPSLLTSASLYQLPSFACFKLSPAEFFTFA